jgi:pimeloyl-ACP methyl ester carboxylesterase
MNRADAWRDKGSYFTWSPRRGDAAEVQCFHVELGDADTPPLVLVHGFPTSSIDWFEVAERLSERYRVCCLRATLPLYTSRTLNVQVARSVDEPGCPAAS